MKKYKCKILKEAEATDPDIQKIANLITSGKKLMDLRKPMENIFPKKNIDFAMEPVAHFRIKTKKGTLIIVNKKYADDSDMVVGDLAIGYEVK